MSTPRPIHTSTIQRAVDTLLWHPQCPDMPLGTEGLASAMEAALLAVRDDLGEGHMGAAESADAESLTCGCGIAPDGAPGTSQGCSAGCMVPTPDDIQPGAR